VVDILAFTMVLGGTCFAFLAVLALVVGVALSLSGGTWRKLRSRARPLLWSFGLDWPEIKRTYKRAFMLYYGRRLPEYTLPASPGQPSSDGALDESGDVSPGLSPQLSGMIGPPSENTLTSG